MSVFQLTTSRGGRPYSALPDRRKHYFNSRPHEEVDPRHLPEWESDRNNFNSRPHEEVDNLCIWESSLSLLISTHDLTKRSTRRVHKSAVSSMYFNSRPHEEVDISTRWGHFYFGKFQLTTSRRGRPIVLARYVNRWYISTHDLTKRSTDDPEGEPEEKPFQLTTSRRGRPLASR